MERACHQVMGLLSISMSGEGAYENISGACTSNQYTHRVV